MMQLTRRASLVVILLLLASVGTASAEGTPTGHDIWAVIVAVALWAWELLKSMTLIHWLLLAVALGLSGVASAIASGFHTLTETLTDKLEPMSEHYRDVEERRHERNTIGDLLRAGAATPEDIDRLNELDAEDRPRHPRAS